MTLLKCEWNNAIKDRNETKNQAYSCFDVSKTPSSISVHVKTEKIKLKC